MSDNIQCLCRGFYMVSTNWLAIPRFDGVDVGLFRVGGPGLGNLLFPWARAHLSAKNFGGRVVWPSWSSLKPARLLRGDLDMRWYSGLFRPPHEGYISGVSAHGRRVLFKGGYHVSHAAALPTFESGETYNFCGMKSMFAPLWDHRELIKKGFFAMSKPAHLRSGKGTVAMHVRLGDFVRTPEGGISGMHATVTNTANSMDWFLGALARVEADGFAAKRVLVYSDGTDAELGPLLRDPRITRAPKGNPLNDISAMATSDALIASQSTFSMWGAFLGHCERPVYGAVPPLADTWGEGNEYRKI